MTISFTDPQDSVTITLGDINGKDSPLYSINGGSWQSFSGTEQTFSGPINHYYY